ncbi:DUF6786 family protein [Reichenbachiella versicolor]|uniref:DUF6786 family protein n=1 Tax=Reichenbachiella versicolor TaxID=1821036 RepID=UPI000D6E586C|nr:DUF6786 family protein [Reichenbachiella versicolor]
MKYLLPLLLTLASCQSSDLINYSTDKKLIENKTELIELYNNDGQSRILIAPAYQGRVLASTLNCTKGQTIGWLNRTELTKDTVHGGQVGGEDRLWFGPLGSQFSFYYQQIEPIHEDNWLVPDSFNNVAYEVIEQSNEHVKMKQDFLLQNFVGTEFDIEVYREVELLQPDNLNSYLEAEIPEGLNAVAFESRHQMINSGDSTWRKETGLVGLWSLGMFPGTDETTVYVPLKYDLSLSDIFQYFEIDNTDILSIKDKLLSFKADGLLRSKFGIPSQYAPELIASYSKDRKLLTVVQYQQTEDSLYYNGHVSVQENPYDGEIVTSYNNGPLDQTYAEERTFYELESQSAMRELAPGDTLTHYHRTFHFSGEFKDLKELAKRIGIQLGN